MSTVTRSPFFATAAYIALGFKRVLTDWANFAFTIILPVVLYLIFGAAQDYGPSPFEDGNLQAFVMIGLALYGGVTATVGHAGSIVVEHRSGWGRQLALTPITTTRIIVSNVVLMAFRGTLPVAAVFVTGWLTGAEMTAGTWAATFVITSVLTLPFGFYGLVWVLCLPNENTVSIASTTVVVLGFLANMFVPLTETLVTIGVFTPMYGAAVLARYPMTEGYVVVSGDLFLVEHPLWWALASLAAWTTTFVVATALLIRRDKERA